MRAGAERVLDAILHAPTLSVPIDDGSGAVIWVKLELQLPSGSTKDRIAARILLAALDEGRLRDDTLVVEASSGSTSISLAMLCAHLGVRFRAVMPEGVSPERLKIIGRYGGEWELTPTATGVPGSIARVQEMAGDASVFWPDQFANPLNAEAHQSVTGPQLLDAVSAAGDRLDGFVAAVGTGGTLMGVGRAVRERFTAATIARVMVADELADAEQGGVPCGIPGVVDCLSALLDVEELAMVPDLPVTHDEALATTRELCERGFPVGPSSGLNVAGARALAAQLGPGARVGTVLCDRMERYFSTNLFDDVPTSVRSNNDR